MNIQTQSITPEIAEQYLKLNKKNRAVNYAHVTRLAKEMKEGRWKLNGDTICVNGNRLIDGQHRLMAVVQSGATIQAIVVHGLADDVFDTKDIGKRRSACDTLTVLGEKNCSLMASALVIVERYMTGRSELHTSYSNQDVEAMLNRYPNIRNSIHFGMDTKGLMKPSAVVALHYLFSVKNYELASSFFKTLISGVGLQEGDPIYLLRERLMANSLSKSKLNREYTIAITIKAWNAKRAGIELKQLKYTQTGEHAEAFPTIL